MGLLSDFEKILSRNGCFVERNDGLVIGEVEILIDSKNLRLFLSFLKTEIIIIKCRGICTVDL